MKRKGFLIFIMVFLSAGSGKGISVGDKAPDFKVRDWKGKDVSLSENLGKRNVLLVFSRYIGCSWCQMFIIDLHRHRKEIADLNTRVIIFNLSENEVLRKYEAPEGFDFELVADPERNIYEVYGVKIDEKKMSGNILWQSVRFIKYIGRYKFVEGGLEGAHYQPHCVFIIGKDGRIRSQHIGKDVADYVKAETILQELKELK
jgi:peroxiredoxin